MCLPSKGLLHCRHLRLSHKLSSRSRSLLVRTWMGLPVLPSSPIFVDILPQLTASRGKLLSGQPVGTAVHAASFIRNRSITLESALLSRPNTAKLIFVHEIFHFVWARLSNSRRREFSHLLVSEIRRGAAGELGESSAVKKSGVLRGNSVDSTSRRWRDYVCESFCDTAAFAFATVAECEDFTLADRWKGVRKEWFGAAEHDVWKC